ncbi:MAG: hypothetical protein CMF59_18350 [Leptospiraceae bacterium]|nr:hypothetical protein [Leptospiraceae bacterium]MBI41560.1 hypothetical protein [Leptospiraceae bacterium]
MQAKRRSSIKRFRFSLESLLRIRSHEEKMAMADLAKVLEKVNVSEEKKKKAQDNYRSEVEQFSREQRESFRLELFQMYDRYLERLESEQVQANEELEAIRPALEAEQQKVMEARRKKRALELLKERRKEQYDLEVRRQEKKELEEINAKAFQASLFGQVSSERRSFEDQDQSEDSQEDLKARREEELKEYYRQMGMPVDDQDPLAGNED